MDKQNPGTLSNRFEHVWETMSDKTGSDSSRVRRWLLVAALLWMAMNNAIMLWNTRAQIRRGYGDFASFYAAGTLVRRGLGAELYDHKAQWKVQQEFASEVEIRQGPLPFIRPPYEALLFSVFARWPYVTSLLLWTVVKLGLLMAIPYVVVRDGSLQSRASPGASSSVQSFSDRSFSGKSWNGLIPLWAVGLLALGTFPEFMDMLLGQDAPLLAFLFAIAYWQLAKGRDVGAGLTLGVALFKFQLVIPFVLALWIAGRKRVLRGFVISGIAALAISYGIVGWRGLLRYPRDLLALNQATGVGLITPENQMNLRGLLIFVAGRVPYPGRIHWLLAPIALGAIVYAGSLWRKAGDRWLAEGFGLSLIAAIVTSYYAYEYDLLLLIIPLLAMLARHAVTRPTVDRVTSGLEAGGWLLLLLTPLYWFARVQLKAECLMVLPLLALGLAWARKLRSAGAAARSEATAPLENGMG
jgi:glycosyl transferase family 87